MTYANRSRNALFNELRTQTILSMIANEDSALVKALDILFNRQEMDEKLAKTSLYFNMKGFRWSHAKRMSEIAISLYGTGRLTAEQKAWLRGSTTHHAMRIGMYWEQIVKAWW